MTEREFEIKLNDHDHEISSLKHRVKDVESEQKELSLLARNVDRLATNMERMLVEQQAQREEINELKQGPAEEYKHYKRLITGCIFTTAVGTIIGALLAIIIK